MRYQMFYGNILAVKFLFHLAKTLKNLLIFQREPDGRFSFLLPRRAAVPNYAILYTTSEGKTIHRTLDAEIRKRPDLKELQRRFIQLNAVSSDCCAI